MIKIQLRSYPRGFVAYTIIERKHYRVASPYAAANKLAKLLRARGIQDQPVEIYNPTGNLAIERSSLFEWADFDFQKVRTAWLREQQAKRKTEDQRWLTSTP